MPLHQHIHIHIHTHMHTHTRIHMHMHMHIHTNISILHRYVCSAASASPHVGSTTTGSKGGWPAVGSKVKGTRRRGASGDLQQVLGSTGCCVCVCVCVLCLCRCMCTCTDSLKPSPFMQPGHSKKGVAMERAAQAT